jgi:hypothetical protein
MHKIKEFNQTIISIGCCRPHHNLSESTCIHPQKSQLTLFTMDMHLSSNPFS